MGLSPMALAILAEGREPSGVAALLVRQSSCEEWGKPIFRLVATLKRCSGAQFARSTLMISLSLRTTMRLLAKAG